MDYESMFPNGSSPNPNNMEIIDNTYSTQNQQNLPGSPEPVHKTKFQKASDAIAERFLNQIKKENQDQKSSYYSKSYSSSFFHIIFFENTLLITPNPPHCSLNFIKLIFGSKGFLFEGRWETPKSKIFIFLFKHHLIHSKT